MRDNPELSGPRANLDRIDGLLLKLLAARSQEVGKIAVIKAMYGIPPYQPERFQQLMSNLQEQAILLGVHPELVDNVWNSIHEDSLRQQDISINNPS